MTKPGKKPPWGAVPFRVCGDRELHGLTLRVLTCIAFHDRFNRNGRGCYAGQATLTRECRTDRKNLWATIQVLKERGYIEEEPDPKDARKRVYRVIYDEEETRSTDRLSLNGLRGPQTVYLAGDMRSGAPVNRVQATDIIDDGKPNILGKTVTAQVALRH